MPPAAKQPIGVIGSPRVAGGGVPAPQAPPLEVQRPSHPGAPAAAAQRAADPAIVQRAGECRTYLAQMVNVGSSIHTELASADGRFRGALSKLGVGEAASGEAYVRGAAQPAGRKPH